MPILTILLATLLGASLSQELPATSPSSATTQPATRWIPAGPAELRTAAETSGFKATGRYGEVVELMDRLAAVSPHARRLSMGKSVEGRELPVIVFADPPLATGEEARRAAAGPSGKLVVLLFGNIHAGEVDGKEALLMLARELALHEGPHPLLKDLVIAIAPIYNADGNERFGPIERVRPGQDGPEQGAGVRHNAQDFDLNRDFVRLESPETQALVRFLRQWDPAIVVDTHTTNGSLHRFLITYAGPKNPAGDGEVIRYSYEKLLPELTQRLKARTGVDTFLYGNFEEEHTKWSSFPPQARYGTNYFGLRNRLGILSESYSYASYEERIRGTLEFCREILSYAQDERQEIRKLLNAADERARRGGAETIALRSEARPLDQKRTALGFVEQQRNGQRIAGEPKEYPVDVLDHWEPTLTVNRPAAYLIPAELTSVLENLQRHGIEVQELREEIETEVTVYTVDEIHRSERAFQGHNLVRLELTPKQETKRLSPGMFVVHTTQPLGALASYLLEPQSEDGLVTWNFFDEVQMQGRAFPVLRLEEDTWLLTTGARPLAEDRETGKRLSFQALYESRSRPSFNGSPVGQLRWIDDDHYLQNRGGQMMKVQAVTGKSEHFGDPEVMTEALAQLPTMNQRTAAGIARRQFQRYSDDYSKVLIDHGNDLYVYDVEEKLAVRLTSTPEAEELAEFSPDGEFVAFVRANDLYVVDVSTQTERALTTGGNDDLRSGKASWVYFEEVFSRSWKAYWWSPDSASIAFLQSDTSMVDNYALADDLPEPRGIELARYPRPGSPNPRVKLGIVSAGGGAVRWADTSSYMPEDLLMTGVGWWPDSGRAWFYAQDRRQTWLDLNTIAPDSGQVSRLLRDQTEAWIEPQGGPHVLEDGSFLLVSDRSGWRHLYRFDKDGELVGPVTEGEWDVRRVELIDEDGGWAFVSGTKDSPIATNLYRVRLDGSAIERLTTEPGSHATNLSPGGARFIDSWSGFGRPTRVALLSSDGSQERMLDTNPVYAIEEYIWGPTEHFQIPTRDGFLMEARLTWPADFDPGRKYPLWITTYAGPYAPSVRNAWSGGDTYEQMLANEGILVLNVDPRPASGKGPRSAWTAYRQLGVQEAKDLEDAVAWMVKNHPVDGRRIGLSGHSYGGYITAFAMTHTKAFSAGIAGAPVTDWRDYDSIYTERYMGTPQDNPEGYDASSAVKGAADLHGELLLLHGAIDDNVHPQNTLRLAKALQDANRKFEMMIYPGMRHGIFGRHYNRLTYDFIRRTMGVGDDPSTESDAPPEEAQGSPRRRAGRGRSG